MLPRPSGAPASIDVQSLITLKNIEAYLSDLNDKFNQVYPEAEFRLLTLPITTSGQMVFVNTMERLINDGPDSVYVLDRNATPKADDASFGVGEVIDLAPLPDGKPWWIKTTSGTATVRYLRGGERSRMLVDIVAQTIATLDVDITAASIGNIAVNIAAVGVDSIPIDIKTQSLGNLAINIAAQSVGNLAVNIAASAITLNVNISSTTANIGVDIKAQTVGNIGVTIAAQTVGSLVIKIGAAQTVSVDGFADWQSQQGTSKAVSGTRANTGTMASYTVTAGKTLYITEWSCSGTAIGSFSLVVNTVAQEQVEASGAPFMHQFKTPLKVTAGLEVHVGVTGTGTFDGNFYGVEI